MKNLLIVTAILESVTGLVLIALPGLLNSLLFGSSPDAPVTLIVARIAGVAIFSLAAACWFSRNEGKSTASKGLVSTLVLYNTAVAVILIYAALGLSMSGFGLWPVVLLHLALSVWCAVSLLNKPLQSSAK